MFLRNVSAYLLRNRPSLLGDPNLDIRLFAFLGYLIVGFCLDVCLCYKFSVYVLVHTKSVHKPT